MYAYIQLMKSTCTCPTCSDNLVHCVHMRIHVQASREFELDDDLRTLSFYAIQNGDTIIVRRK